MKYRQLGRSGLMISVYALGTNSFGTRADEASSLAIVHHALDNGVNIIDTANVYGKGASETIIGKALLGRRDQVILATKVGVKVGPGPNDFGASRFHIFRELEGSLRRLQTDYIDLYQIHRFDPRTPVEETLRALDDLVRLGNVRYVGCSNHDAWQLCKALWASDRLGLASYQSVQPSYSLVDRAAERELLPLCRDQGVGFIAYHSLGGGMLTGKYRLGSPPPEGSRAVTQPQYALQLTGASLRLAESCRAMAGSVGVTPAQLSLAWVLGQEGVTAAIVGATRVEQQEENLRSVEIDLSPEILAHASEISSGRKDGDQSFRLDSQGR